MSGVNSLKTARFLRRCMLPVALICGALLFYNFGTLKVPKGMDTMMDSVPAGTTCLIQKRPSKVVVGNVVFVDLPRGGTLVTRVDEVRGDRFTVRHENSSSRFGTGESLGELSVAMVRGIVIASFIP